MNRINTNSNNFWSYVIFFSSIVLFIASFTFKYFSFNKISVEHRTKELEKKLHRQEKDATSILFDTALIKRLASARETQNDLNYLYKKPYCFYVYKKSGNTQYLRFWNTALVIIPDNVLDEKKDEQFVHLSNGYYYIKRLPCPYAPNIKVYCAILVKSQFFITTQYFKQSFPLNTSLDKIADVSEKPTPNVVKSLSGDAVFYIKQKNKATTNYDSLMTVVVRLISFFLIFLFIYFLLYKNVVRKYKYFDIPLFVCCLLAFRVLLYVFRNVFKLYSLDLFDPQIYATNFFLPSLGDLLINSLLFCWFGVFIWNRLKPSETSLPLPQTKTKRWTYGIVGIIVLLGITLTVINVIRNIIADSKISFDVTDFFSLSIYTAVGFIILAFLTLGFHYFSRIIYHYLFPAFEGRVYWIYIFIAFFGLLYISFIASPSSVNVYLFCLVWLLLYTFLFNNEASLVNLIKFNISSILVWIFIFSVSISILMLTEINKAELNHRKVYVEKLDTQSDPSTERLMDIANTYLDSSFFRNNFNRFYDKKENTFLRDSILTNNYARYIKEYSGQLYFFDSTNNPLHNPDSLSYESFKTIVFRQSTPTETPDLYFYETSYDRFAYITYREIYNNETGNLIGTVGIISQPKKFSYVTLNPELFRQKRDWEFSNSTVYNYAIYSNKLLISSSKKYPFTYTLVQSQIPKQKFELKNKDGYSELWYRAGKNKVIVMTRENDNTLETITLFSYIFCTFLFLIALIEIATSFISFILNKRLSRRRLQISTTIRGQIHNTFILITVISFVVIGIATISFFTQRFEASNTERLGRTVGIMLNEMQSNDELGSLIYEQRLKKDALNPNELDDIIKRIADIHGVDANIYDFTGKLLATSQPDVYSKGVLSMKIDPRAFYYLLRLRYIEHTQKEKVSDLSYTSMYAPIRSAEGTFNAYLSIPYFTSQQVLNQEISKFLVTLINLNAFIFLITGLVALLIANRITRSFALIKDKLMQVNLSKYNEMIEWDRNDEIGGLVTEYNKMVSKLQDSADALAKSEREEAWREMARQVAHEIKNPLTPMKLSLQYLQKAINNDSPNVQQLTVNVSKTLVEQIDHLSKIAADFSQFANINKVNKEIFDLHEVIISLITIYSKNPDVDIEWNSLPNDVNIFADKTQINRVFTNLFINAIEAAKADTKCKIIINEKMIGNHFRISVADNGVGIADDMKNKIFIPNFTTKSSGTGLGLAMCKSIIEQSSGEIYFETEPNNGTTFYITIPIVNNVER